ncbi:cell wall-active antibiotics response protein LiaF [Enterococcus asini]|uniref:cell wall-active antibiotics response protein LiaF n=1 Tax=Enterococcus asini TaxID=57732 RepID=UPI0028911E99|nr:cell wall-active antibiotics response protein LiaF [Enterococcus asini]MDT2756599.1 cell wall-active antibiotics response protein LiaF [Enterococcus asini]
MQNPWRFFFVGEALLLLWAVYQIISSPQLIILLVFGILCLYIGLKRRKHNGFWYIIGGVSIFISLVSSPALWLMLIFAIVFMGLKGIEVSGIDPSKNAFWKKKQITIVEGQEPEAHSGTKVKQSLFGNERIGNQVFEWDDINLLSISGDTIIDLGNTILPKRDNVVLVRKGVGRTRILVPLGVGIMVEHATFAGDLIFEGEQNTLRNESLKVYSEDYDDNPRRIKIITSTFLGDVEVIRI